MMSNPKARFRDVWKDFVLVVAIPLLVVIAVVVVASQFVNPAPPRRITISTSGLAPAIERLATEPVRPRLAVSLNATTDALRDKLMPVNRKYPLARLLADAIDYAESGVPVTASQAANTQAKRAELETVPGFAERFLPEGVPAKGAIFLQRKLGATLRRLTEAGLGDFYRGDLAHSMASELAALGSPLALADLQAYSARLVKPLALQHSLGRLYNMTPPTQGVVSLAILGIAERLGLARLAPESADHVHAIVEATKIAFLAIRDPYVTDPAHMQVEPQALLDPARLDALAAQVDLRRARPWPGGSAPGGTVWMGVIDGSGRAASFIQSIYFEFGSGVVLRESHVNWQNRGCSFSLEPAHVNALLPGKKPFHTLNPALARMRDGRTLAYGTMGGDGQPQTQAAVFSRYAVFGQGLQQAVGAPRWLLGRTWGSMSETLKLESRFAPETVAELRRRGHEVELLTDFDETMGHAGALVRHADGMLEGAFDPRSDGAVAGW